MRISSSVAVLAFAAALAGGAAAQAQTAPAFDAARISEDIRVLSDDSFEGRGIATPAEQKVIDYLSRQYAAAGFAPGGENGGWTQAVGLNRFTVSNVSGRLKLGDWSQSLSQGQEVTMTTRLPSDGVDLKDAPLVSVGYDGPVEVEPFDPALQNMEPDAAVRAAGESLARVWGLIAT